MDTQTTEILGRNRLVADLLVAGLEVSMPLRDRGIDLIAYLDLASHLSRFTAVPIQMKAATAQSFSIDTKYEKFSNLIIANVWGVGTPGQEEIFALTYPEVFSVANEMQWTLTRSWESGIYATTAPSKKLRGILEQYRMHKPEQWHDKVTGLSPLSQTE